MEVLARDLGLWVPDFAPLAAVSRELAEGSPVPVWDPEGVLTEALRPWPKLFPPIGPEAAFDSAHPLHPKGPSIYADWRAKLFPLRALVMVPPVIALGVGCHRGVEYADLLDFVSSVFAEHGVLLRAVAVVASVDIRKNEPALLELAEFLNKPFVVYGKSELAKVKAPNPSDKVLERIGVSSVCEAAALSAARTGSLLVPKQKSRTATMAAAKMSFT
jgi:cobalt-precorrin 5A hydrolase